MAWRPGAGYSATSYGARIGTIRDVGGAVADDSLAFHFERPAMYDLVVIGEGAGGLRAATAAAAIGARVALIEKRPEGGGSGAVASKGVSRAVGLLRRVREAGAFGIETGAVSADFARVMGRARDVAAAVAARDAERLARTPGLDVFRGTAAFEAYDAVTVDGGKPVAGRRFIIASGSRPSMPNIKGFKELGCLDAATVWNLSRAPKGLVVIGAGPLGLEIAQAFARLGSRVTVVAESPGVLPGEDADAAALVERALTSEGITFKLGATPVGVERRGDQKAVVYRNAAGGPKGEALGAEVVATSGRLANVEGLNLDVVGVHADPEHGVQVDEFLQTDAPRIYAIGDVLLRHAHANAAEHEADVAVGNAVLRRRRKVGYDALARVAFLDPEFAAVGLTPAQAEADGRAHQVIRVEYADDDRAWIDGRTEGFAKVVVTPSGKVLGATVVGEEANLVIQELALAIRAGLRLTQVAEAVPIHPSYAGVVKQAADRFRASRFERGFWGSAFRMFYGFEPRPAAVDEPAPEAEPAEPAVAAHGHGH